jgi:transketolase
MTHSSDAIDTLCINTLRTLSIDAVEKAASGHPGLPMGAATMAYVLWTRHMRYDPSAPEWINRDRFVLSAGHGSMLLYSLLFVTGYGLTIDDLQHFRRWGSRTPGHPERGVTTGVEVTTGPLGQGLETLLVWQWQSDGSPPRSTGRATTSSTTIRSSSRATAI